ncbi:MAG TPA: hypothetical protein DD670_07425 [Planctomycetaceae bacterium]|nr:hypothetical protein [Planctomycetaceae bacterium]
MEHSEFLSVRPALENAIREIDDLLARLRANDQAEQSHEAFAEAWEAGKRDDDLPALESAFVAWGHPWPESARRAAAWLREAGAPTEAAAIDVELAELPQYHPDQETWREQNACFQAAAERVRTILEACVSASGQETAGDVQKSKGGGGRKADPAIAKRNARIEKDFANNLSVDAIVEKHGVSVHTARRVKSDAKKRQS